MINGEFAYVICVPNERDGGLQAFSRRAQTGLDPEGISVFCTHSPAEKIEVYNDYVIPRTLAVEAVKEFAETGTLPKCLEWDGE